MDSISSELAITTQDIIPLAILSPNPEGHRDYIEWNVVKRLRCALYRVTTPAMTPCAEASIDSVGLVLILVRLPDYIYSLGWWDEE